jgi:dihydrofolate reductase
VFIATSLDGFIAREDGSLDWLPAADSREDYGYAAFMAGVDVLVMGRVTYEAVRGLGEWPYGNTPVVVLSHSEIDVSTGTRASVEAMSAAPSEVLRRLEARGLTHAYVDGGRTIQGFLKAGLIDDLVITRVPVLLGLGIPLFGPREGDIPLRHVETLAFASGLVQSRYEVLTTS